MLLVPVYSHFSLFLRKKYNKVELIRNRANVAENNAQINNIHSVHEQATSAFFFVHEQVDRPDQ